MTDHNTNAIDGLAMTMCKAAVVKRLAEASGISGSELPTFAGLQKMVYDEWEDYRHLASLAACQLRSRWFPIETAPMDKDVLLMLAESDLPAMPIVKVGRWVSQEDAARMAGQIVGKSGAFLVCEPAGLAIYGHGEVTMWAEMPQ